MRSQGGFVKKAETRRLPVPAGWKCAAGMKRVRPENQAMENDSPQPQVDEALGLTNTKPLP